MIRFRFLVLKLLVMVIAMTVTMTSSCSSPQYVSDPVSNTPGYRLFTGKNEGFRISFEYPDTWQRQGIDNHDESIWIILKVLETSSIYVVSDVNSNRGGDYENASELIQHSLDIDSERPEFQVLSHTEVRLGEVEGEELIYSYRFIVESDPHLPSGTIIDRVVVNVILAADYKGRIYSIGLDVNANDYEDVKTDYEHFVETFRFLD